MKPHISLVAYIRSSVTIIYNILHINSASNQSNHMYDYKGDAFWIIPWRSIVSLLLFFPARIVVWHMYFQQLSDKIWTICLYFYYLLQNFKIMKQCSRALLSPEVNPISTSKEMRSHCKSAAIQESYGCRKWSVLPWWAVPWFVMSLIRLPQNKRKERIISIYLLIP